MKSYIFFTDEGYTQDSNNKEISNMQILGSADGKDTVEAFKNFKEDHSYLTKFSFKNVIALEFVGDFIRNLEL